MRSGLLLLAMIGPAIFSAGDEEQDYRNARSLEILQLTQKADAAIASWVTKNKGEEDTEVRRYFTGDLDGDGREDLVVVTCLTDAGGNWWSHDFVVELSSRPEKPIIQNFGGKGYRSFKNVSVSQEGILVDLLYYGPSDALCCPSLPGQSLFVLKGNGLVEKQIINPTIHR